MVDFSVFQRRDETRPHENARDHGWISTNLFPIRRSGVDYNGAQLVRYLTAFLQRGSASILFQEFLNTCKRGCSIRFEEYPWFRSCPYRLDITDHFAAIFVFQFVFFLGFQMGQ